jgi:hypothetical protein
MTSSSARRLAAAVRRRGLAAPARLLADAHRPVAPLLDDLGAAVGPLLRAAGATGVARWLAGPDALEGLIGELDRTEGEGDGAG